MNWPEALCCLYSQRFGSISDDIREQILRNDAAIVNTDPHLILYRYRNRPGAFPTTPHGNVGYDAMGSYAMNVTGTSSGIDEDFYAFYTVVQSELTLPEQFTLKMTGKKPGFFSGLRKKVLDHWTIKGNCSKNLTEQLAQIVQEIDPVHKHFYEISLFPNDSAPFSHILTVKTNRIPWEIDSFNAVSDYYATDANGRRMGSKDAAILCMENLVKINIACYRMIARSI